mgnify:FL=1
MVYKVELVRRLAFITEAEGRDAAEAKLNAIEDFSVAGGSVTNEAEELRTLATLVDEGTITPVDVKIL